MGADSSQSFEAERAHLTRLAYRMLGSVSEAEDAVQDAYLAWHRTDRSRVDSPRAFLSQVTTRLCLDKLRRARRRRESYVGEWLPEPLIEELESGAAPSQTDHDVSMALMLALERLSPLERAAFILHDIFEMGFDEIAAALDRTEAACRQLASRARSHVLDARPRFSVAPGDGVRLAEAFFSAARSGDAEGLRTLLAQEATLHSDGGGRKAAATKTLLGATNIVRFFQGLASKGIAVAPLWSRRVTINGQPGLLSLEQDGTLQTTSVEIQGDRISAIYVTRNPEKLLHLLRLLPEEVARQVVM